MHSPKMTIRLALGMAAATCLLAAGCMSSMSDRKGEAMEAWNRQKLAIACNLAENQMNHNKLDKAAQTLTDALASAPENERARILLGKVLLNQGQFAAAGVQFKFVLERNEKQDEAHYLLGVCFQRLAKPDDALGEYARAAELVPANPAYLIAHAEGLVAVGRGEEAAAMLGKRVEEFGDSVPVLAAVAEVQSACGHDREAAHAAAQALDIDPESARLREILAVSLYRMGRHDEAVPVLLKLAQAKDPEPLISILVMLGDCYARLGDLEEAGAWLRKAAQRQDATAEVRLQLAKVLAQMDEPEQAMIVVQETLRLEPANGDALAMKALLLLEAGQAEKAVAMLGDAVSRHPKDTTLRMLLGRSLVLTGRPSAAIVEFKQVLEDDPKDELARAMLEDIQPRPEPKPEPAPEPAPEPQSNDQGEAAPAEDPTEADAGFAAGIDAEGDGPQDQPECQGDGLWEQPDEESGWFAEDFPACDHDGEGVMLDETEELEPEVPQADE